MSVVSLHAWRDDALQLRGRGRGWVADARFTCTKCGLERRMISAEKDSDARTAIYFVGGRRVDKAPGCVGQQDEDS